MDDQFYDCTEAERSSKECKNVTRPEPTDQLAAFDEKSFAKDLIDRSLRGENIDVLLLSHWREMVPKCYHYTEDLKSGIIDNYDGKVLFYPLKALLCESLDPTAALESLKASNTSRICGHIFEIDEALYHCRTCSVDSTCVLCGNCFFNSDHRNHRYRMSCSSGGGFCDCGDPDAWTQSVYCNIHKPKDNQMDKEYLLKLLPEQTIIRTRHFFSFLMNFAIDCLCLLTYDRLPDGLSPSNPSEEYVTMLLNDEIHSYGEVIGCLVNVLKIFRSVAYDLATLVDKEGRTAIKLGSLSECSEVKAFIDNNVSTRRQQPPLRTNVMSADVVAHQHFSIKLIKWLEEIVQYSEVFRILLCEVIREEKAGEGSSLLRRMLLNDDILWKGARATCHSLFVKCFFMDPESKGILGKAYIESYSDIWRHFIEGYDENFSFSELSVQLLTVPTLAWYLIKEHNAFEVITSLFAQYCENYLKEDGFLSFQGQYASNEFRKAQSILFDLKYLVSSITIDNRFDIQENFLKGMRSFFGILNMLQGMDPSIRQTYHHLETDPEWETGFNISIRLYCSIKMLLNLCIRNKTVAMEILINLLNSLKAYTCRRNTYFGYEEVTCLNHSANCIKFCVLTDPVSVHYPTSRFLSAHLFNLQSLEMFKEAISLFEEKIPLCWLFEPALRVRVLAAQCNAGLWKKNGSSLLNQLHLYTNIRCRDEMFDRDLTALQIGASVLEPNVFLLHVLHRYNITKWLSTEGLILFKSDVANYTYRQLAVMIDDFLELIIYIICERYKGGIGQVDEIAYLEMEIIHALCYRPLTHNELTRAVLNIGADEEEVKYFNEVVQKVADIRKSSDKIIYEVKEECLSSFNPYFYHYTREERAKAEENYLEYRAKKKLSSCILIPLPPLFTETFSNVLNLLQCDLMLHIFNTVLQKSLVVPSTSVWTESQLRKVLHLIGLALLEQKRSMNSNLKSFQFIKREREVFEGSIFRNIQLVVLSEKADISSSVRDLASEILKLYHNVDEGSAAYDTFLARYTDDQQKKVFNKMKRKERAMARRDKAVASMTNLQRKFIQANKELYESTVVEQELTSKTNSVEMLPVNESLVCMGPTYTHTEPPKKFATCIVCQETQEVNFDNAGIGLLGYAQKSNLFCDVNPVLDAARNPHDLFPGFSYGINVNSCGHYMHLTCYENYMNVAGRNYRQIFVSGGRNYLPFDPDAKECLCPLCNAISNILIPSLPSLSFTDNNAVDEKSFEDWFKCISEVHQDLKFEDFESFYIFKVNNPIQDAVKVLTNYVASNLENFFGTKDSNSRKSELSDSLIKLMTEAAEALRMDRDEYRAIAASICNICVFVSYCAPTAVSGDENNYPGNTSEAFPLHIWLACSYSIESFVYFMESEGKKIYSNISIQNETLIDALVSLSALYPIMLPSSVLRSISTDLLTTVFFPELCGNHRSLLNLNMFNMLVSFSLSLPSLVARSEFSAISNYRHITFWYTLRMFFAIHCIQVLTVSDWTFHESEADDSDIDEDSDFVYSLHVMVKGFLRKSILPKQYAKTIRLRLISSVLPFLRCCCLFYKALFHTSFPSSLSEGFAADKSNSSQSCVEYKSVCSFLSLPFELHQLFKQMPETFASKIQSWCESCKNFLIPVQYPLRAQKLVDLPKDYVSLLALTVSDRVLNEINPTYPEDSHVISICLLCGDIIISTPQKIHMRFDSRVGMSVMHTLECGIQCGIFLRVKESIVSLINIISRSPLKVRGSFYSAPYIDEYGDTDDGLKRGNPLYFSKEIYNKLQRIWLSHGIPDVISRASQSQQIAFATNWDLI